MNISSNGDKKKIFVEKIEDIDKLKINNSLENVTFIGGKNNMIKVEEKRKIMMVLF